MSNYNHYDNFKELDSEELSEEFKEQTSILFEEAVTERVNFESKKLNEKFDTYLELMKEGLIEKIDGYLSYLAEKWFEKNELSLEQNVTKDVFEQFTNGMRSLEGTDDHKTSQHYEMVDKLDNQVTKLSEKLALQLSENVKLRKKLFDYKKTEIVNEYAEDLSLNDKEKFHALVEDLSFKNIEQFEEKVQSVRENYFNNHKPKKHIRSVVTDIPITVIEDTQIPSNIKGYLTVLDSMK
jgi:hypothetical protein